MSQTTNWLLVLRRVIKLYERMIRKVCAPHGLTSVEADIVCFLQNNPGKDTAGDIVEYRMLSKGNVSQGVESLIQKSLLQRTQDQEDRRKIHLHLLPAAQPIVHEIKQARQEFVRTVLQGFSEEERWQYVQMNLRIAENCAQALEGEDQP